MNSRRSVIGSQVIGQLALVAVIPVLTRHVDPTELGVFHVAFAVCMLLQPVASLRIEFAIPGVASESEYTRLLRIAWTTLLVTGAGLFACSGTMLLLGFSEAALWICVPALLVVAYAGMNIDNAKLIRSGLLGRLSLRNVLAGVLAACLQLLAIVVLPTALGLALAVLAGRLLALVFTRARQRSALLVPSAKSDLDVAWTIRRGITAVMTSIVSAGALQMLVLYAALATGPAAAAQIGVAQRSASAPLGLLSQGLSQTMQAGVASAVRARKSSLLDTIDQQVKSLGPLAACITIGLLVGGPILAEPVFGQGWEPVGTIIALLAIPSGLQLLFAPVTVVYYMIGKEKDLLVMQIGWLIVALSSTTASHAISGNFLWGIGAFSAASSVYYVTAYAMLRSRIRTFVGAAG